MPGIMGSGVGVESQGEGTGASFTTVWKELGAEDAYWIAAHHYGFTLLLVILTVALWWKYRCAMAELDRYRGRGDGS